MSVKFLNDTIWKKQIAKFQEKEFSKLLNFLLNEKLRIIKSSFIKRN